MAQGITAVFFIAEYVQNTAGAPSVLSFYCGDAAFGQQIRNLAG